MRTEFTVLRAPFNGVLLCADTPAMTASTSGLLTAVGGLLITFGAANARADDLGQLPGAQSLEASVLPKPAAETPRQIAMELARLSGGMLGRVANTHSMEPAITTEHLLVVAPARMDELKRNDVILWNCAKDCFLSGNGLSRAAGDFPSGIVCHRVIGRTRSHVTTKGDALKHADLHRVVQEDLIGRVIFVIDGRSGEIRDFRTKDQTEVLSLERARASL
jgi:hypothetical protein